MDYTKHIKDLQIQRLRERQNQMNFLLAYHTRMEDETSDPRVRELHHHQASELHEACHLVDKLLQEMEHPNAL